MIEPDDSPASPRTETELARAYTEIADLRVQLHSANTAVIRLRARLDEMDAEIAKLKTQLQAAPTRGAS
jgi:septal ring factor EnvC (AmiA/AmiB activator)